MHIITQGPGAIFAGIIYPLRSLWLFISNPRLRRYMLMPIVINVLLFITLYSGLLWAGQELLDALFNSLPTWGRELAQGFPALPHGSVALPEWHLNWPAIAWPRLALPHIPWPQIPWPQISWPQISWPQIPWPQIPWPQGLTNLFSWQFTTPEWLQPILSWRPQLPAWLGELPEWGLVGFLWLLRLLLTLVLFVVTGFIFLQFGVLLGAPWYGKLSEELERMQTGSVKLVEVGLARDVGRAILYELKKLALSLGIGLPLLLLNVFVGPGTAIATIGGVALAATIACLDFVDSALERRRFPFRRKLQLVGQAFPASASFGLVCLALVSIPFVNLLAIPVCVGAGTLFCCDRILPLLPEAQQGN